MHRSQRSKRQIARLGTQLGRESATNETEAIAAVRADRFFICTSLTLLRKFSNYTTAFTQHPDTKLTLQSN